MFKKLDINLPVVVVQSLLAICNFSIIKAAKACDNALGASATETLHGLLSQLLTSSKKTVY
jgi:hypothetical protein